MLATFSALLAGLSAAARAQDPSPLPDPGPVLNDPGSACADATNQDAGCDTELTPVAKEDDEQAWTHIGGARFGQNGELVEGSPTSYTVDFYTVRFQTPELGFAGGAACPEDTSFAELHDDYCGPSREEGTPRVPVIYRYLDPDGPAGEEPGAWEEYYRGTSKGYVGSIAFLSPAGEEAIAVGGTGNYPRRELGRCAAGGTPATDPDCDENDPPTGETDEDYAARDLAGEEENAAGRARVWTYRTDQWREQSDLPATPQGDPMRGFTAVDCSPRLQEGRRCLAGAYRQLWLWQGSEFTKAFTDKSQPPDVDFKNKGSADRPAAERFIFRVRAIEFAPGSETPTGANGSYPQAVVVTAGCCAESKARNQPRIMDFLGGSVAVDVQPLVPSPQVYGPDEAEGTRKGTADSAVSLNLTPWRLGVGARRVSLVLSPGGPEQGELGPGTPRPPEPPSSIVREAVGQTSSTDDVNGIARVAGVRLLAGDGDFAGPPAGSLDDGLLDWAVGEATSTGQGVAYTTLETLTTKSDALDCPPEALQISEAGVTALSECQLKDSDSVVTGTKSKRLVGLPTYALNGFSYTPDADEAWAAGDKGALIRLGGKAGKAALGAEPQPPTLGAHQQGDLGDRSPYEGLGPEGSGPVGRVPPLAVQAERRLPEPKLLPGGVPDPTRSRTRPREDVTEIVMSRDGTEGWALGNATFSNGGTTLFHYHGGRWTRCETDSVPGIVEADPACAGLAALRNAQSNGGPDPIVLPVAARVPLERDSDPSNDDEFELLAIGERYTLAGESAAHNVVARYRGGRWSIDAPATRSLDMTAGQEIRSLALGAPDDGWVVDGVNKIFHFDGEKWTSCQSVDGSWASECGNDSLLLPASASDAGGDLSFSEAGGRVYLAGTRVPGGVGGGVAAALPRYPMVLYKDPDGQWSHDRAQGGFDPGCESQDVNGGCVGSGLQEDQGKVKSIAVSPAPGGGHTGWVSGSFGKISVAGQEVEDSADDASRKALSRGSVLLRLEPNGQGGGSWVPWDGLEFPPDEPSRDRGDAANDSLRGSIPQLASLSIPWAPGDTDAWIVPTSRPNGSHGGNPAWPMLAFRDGRWQAAGTPFGMRPIGGALATTAQAVPQELGPDGRGGFWLAVNQAGTALSEIGSQVAFYHYTDRAPEPVFTEAPHPIREQITAATGGPDGSFWVATASDAVYRYDRIGGWERVRVPGWDPGRVVTRSSEATAIAIGPGGEGLLVGKAGRIAELAPRGVRLDQAAGAALCEVGGSGPCGTGRTLRAAAIAPDGSALVGGDGRALLWRSGEGEFHAIAPPPTTANTTITGIAYPQASQAFLTTELGQVWVGDPSSSDPRWRVENRDSKSGYLESVDGSGNDLELRAIAIDGSGHGYAVGEQGVVIERTGDPDEPWRRIDDGLRDDFYSVALPAAGGGGAALIGGAGGVIYTLSDGEFEVARPADLWDPLTAAHVSGQQTARIVGVALLPGSDPGNVEAWAASSIPSGEFRQPSPVGILHYASDPSDPLLDPTGAAEPLPDAPDARPGELTLAALGRSECQTSTVNRCPEAQDSNMASDAVVRRIGDEIIARRKSSPGPMIAAFTGDVGLAAGRDGAADTPLSVDVIHRRWTELVASRFAEARVLLLGAPGGRDLSQVTNCPNSECYGTQQAGGAGTSGPWRSAMAGMRAPWGEGEPLSEDGIDYVPVGGDALAESPASGGANTHYALDAVTGGEKLLRLVVADNSLRSLAASEPNQSSVETGGQEGWLASVLCRQGEGAGCTRGADEPAVVVANTPTYSYGPGGLEHTATDAATFEQTLLEHEVSALIAGRLGWNGLYYTCAPQLHTPAPGGEYPTAAPRDLADCAGQQDTSGLPAEPPDPNELLGGLTGRGFLPTAIAASAGGRFGPDREGTGSAAEGFWHGYTVVRVPADGNRAGVVVEQRPVFDWVSIRPAPGERPTRLIRAGKKLALEGFGREVAGTDAPLRYDEITTAAITHRYDLLVADPDRPWLPKEGTTSDGCDPYDCLPSNVGTVHNQSGQVKAGNGNYPRTYAIAALSVGDKSASYPLVFEPRASFRVQPAPPAPPVAVPPPPPPPAPAQPTTPQVNLPAAPVIPVLTAQALAPPPVPPSPPTFASEAPLDLNISPAALDVTPPTAVSQPPTPPVNPAPPGGARKEARQRQAAAQKSGADSDQEQGSNETGDLAQGPEAPTGSAMTRHDFTAVADRHQPSAWARDALLGGGLGIAALLLATGVRTARPTPRRREPELPAPAFARARGQRRR